MAILFRRFNGINYLVSDHQGRRVWRPTGKRRRVDAENYVRKIVHNTTQIEAAPKRHTFLQCVCEWRTYAETNLSKSTIRLYEESVRNLVRILGDRDLHAYTPMDTEKLKSTRLKEVSPSKTKIDFRNVKAILNVAVKWGLLGKNPCAGVKLVKIPPQKPAYLTKDDFSRLIESIQTPWLRGLVAFAVSTMMRAGELAKLSWDSIDLGKRIIQGENKDDFRLKTTQPRVFPMNDWVYGLLSSRENRAGYVFTLPSGHKLSVDCISKTSRKPLEKSVYPKRSISIPCATPALLGWFRAVGLYTLSRKFWGIRT